MCFPCYYLSALLRETNKHPDSWLIGNTLCFLFHFSFIMCHGGGFWKWQFVFISRQLFINLYNIKILPKIKKIKKWHLDRMQHQATSMVGKDSVFEEKGSFESPLQKLYNLPTSGLVTSTSSLPPGINSSQNLESSNTDSLYLSRASLCILPANVPFRRPLHDLHRSLLQGSTLPSSFPDLELVSLLLAHAGRALMC